MALDLAAKQIFDFIHFKKWVPDDAPPLNKNSTTKKEEKKKKRDYDTLSEISIVTKKAKVSSQDLKPENKPFWMDNFDDQDDRSYDKKIRHFQSMKWTNDCKSWLNVFYQHFKPFGFDLQTTASTDKMTNNATYTYRLLLIENSNYPYEITRNGFGKKEAYNNAAIATVKFIKSNRKNWNLPCEIQFPDLQDDKKVRQEVANEDYGNWPLIECPKRLERFFHANNMMLNYEFDEKTGKARLKFKFDKDYEFVESAEYRIDAERKCAFMAITTLFYNKQIEFYGDKEFNGEIRSKQKFHKNKKNFNKIYFSF